MTRQVSRRDVLGLMGVTLGGRSLGEAADGAPTGQAADGPATVAEAGVTEWLPAPDRLPGGDRYEVEIVESPADRTGRDDLVPVPAGLDATREITLATHRGVVGVFEGDLDRRRVVADLEAGGHERVAPVDGAPAFLRTTGRSVRLAAVGDEALVLGLGRERAGARDAVAGVLAARAGRTARYLDTDDAMARVADRTPPGDVVVLDPAPAVSGVGPVAVAESLSAGRTAPTLRTVLTADTPRRATAGGGSASRLRQAGGRSAQLPPTRETTVEFVDGGRTAVATARLERPPGATDGPPVR